MKYSLFYLTGLAFFATSCRQTNSDSAREITVNTHNIEKNSDESLENTAPLKIIDTLLAVNNHLLHFKIYTGEGIPILFENGAGDDCSIWDTVLIPVSKITGTTLITYDRAGFGLSTIDTTEKDISKHGVLNGLNDLEYALQMLGYNQDIILVSHSYGGYYTTLYAGKHPDLVKSIVLIDVNHNFYENTAEQEIKDHQKETMEWKKKNIAFYYMAVNLAETAKIMSQTTIPESIPVVDLVDGISFHETIEKTERWMECHKTFVETHPKSVGITAVGCSHYIWLDNPHLVIAVIARSYAETMNNKEKSAIYKKIVDYLVAPENFSRATRQIQSESQE